MKNRGLANRLAVLGVIVTPLLGSMARAQLPGGSPAGVDLTLLQLLEKVPAFSARADARVADSDQIELVATPMLFSKLDDKVRIEVDMTQLKGRTVDAAEIARLKQLGMDRVISIIRPGKKELCLVYPGLSSYVSVPWSGEAAAAGAGPKLTTVPLGKETISGHPCVKNRVTVTGPAGPNRELLVWNATDLKEFPVQVRHTEGGTTVLMRFSDIKLARPDAALFEPPPGYAKFDDFQEMLQASVPKKENPKAGK